MKKRVFEDFIYEQKDNFDYSGINPNLWNKIEVEIKEKKKKKFAVIIGSVFLLCLLTASGTFVFYGLNNDTLVKNNPTLTMENSGATASENPKSPVTINYSKAKSNKIAIPTPWLRKNNKLSQHKTPKKTTVLAYNHPVKTPLTNTSIIGESINNTQNLPTTKKENNSKLLEKIVPVINESLPENKKNFQFATTTTNKIPSTTKKNIQIFIASSVGIGKVEIKRNNFPSYNLIIKDFYTNTKTIASTQYNVCVGIKNKKHTFQLQYENYTSKMENMLYAIVPIAGNVTPGADLTYKSIITQNTTDVADTITSKLTIGQVSINYGYQIKLNEWLEFSPTVSIGYNKIKSGNLAIFDPATGDIMLRNDMRNIVKTNFYNIAFNPQIGFNINHKINFFINPKMMYGINNISNNIWTERVKSRSLQFGLKYNF